MQILKTNSSNKHFINLVSKLDAYLKIVDGDDHYFYNQFNGIENLKYCIVLYKNKIAVACGAIKKYNQNTAEVKRMFVDITYRNNGFASLVLKNLEAWASELKFEKIILETGKKQVEAVKFYKKNNYDIIKNFGPYVKMENSICFEKIL